MQCLYARLLLITFSILSAIDARAIHCRKCRLLDECKAKLNKQIRCVYISYWGIPIPESVHEITVGRPKKLHAKPFLLKRSNKTRLALKVTWKQERFKVKNLTGYFFRIQMKNTVVTSLRIYVNRNFLKNLPISRIPVKFHLTYVNEHEIKPGRKYHLNMMSMPLYHWNTDISDVEDNCILNIPGCTDKAEYSTLKVCKDEERDRKREEELNKKRKNKWLEKQKLRALDKEKKRNETAERNSVQVVYIVVPIVILLCLIAIILFVYVYRKRNRLSKFHCVQTTSQKLLIVVNKIDEPEMYQEAANVVASMLGNHHAFNLWDNNNFAGDPTAWVQKRMSECEHVLFICTPQGKIKTEESADSSDTLSSSEFALVYNQVLSSSRFSFTCVYFDVNSDSIPIQLRNKENTYQLPEKLDEFLCNSTGKKTADYIYQIEKLKDEIANIRTGGRSTNVYLIEKNSSPTATRNIDADTRKPKLL